MPSIVCICCIALHDLGPDTVAMSGSSALTEDMNSFSASASAVVGFDGRHNMFASGEWGYTSPEMYPHVRDIRQQISHVWCRSGKWQPRSTRATVLLTSTRHPVPHEPHF
jgi:hypothetical protein